MESTVTTQEHTGNSLLEKHPLKEEIINTPNIEKHPLKEEILSEDNSRFTTFPLKYDDIWEAYKKQVENMWVAEEIDLSADLTDWEKLTDNEKHFIKYVLAFFAASDGIVSENIIERFSHEIKITEAKYFYAFQNMMENIHSETYSMLLETYITDTEEKEVMFNAIKTIPSIKRKAKWAQKWIGDSSYDRLPDHVKSTLLQLVPRDGSDDIRRTYQWLHQPRPTFPERLFAYILVEGLLFSGSFCAIYWLKKRGLMPGLTLSNEFIARDEGMHQDFGALMYSKLEHKLSAERAYEIIKEAVEIEKEFINDALPCRLLNMDADKMSQYIEFVADRILVQTGYPKIWNSKNPFPFMVMMSLPNKSNFFEKRVSNYRKFGVRSSKNEEK